MSAFEATGLKNGSLSQQLHLFINNISSIFYNNIPLQTPKNWLEAFNCLTQAIKTVSKEKKCIIFIDEIPWFSTPKSGFIQALDCYWNTTWSSSGIKLIVCVSAASWMLDNLVYTKEGLHNRLTETIPMRPFTLLKTEEYLRNKNINFTREQIVSLYMTIGGIPHYLSKISTGLSVLQNINSLFFQKDDFLFNEFTILFSSLFDKPEAQNEIIRLLAASKQGLSREEILHKSKLSSSGGVFKQRFNELEEAGFIARFLPYGYANKGTFFRIIDEYVLFYLKWIEPASKRL